MTTPGVELPAERLQDHDAIEFEQIGWLHAIWLNHQMTIAPTIAVAIVLGVWEALVRAGSINPLFLSSPYQVAERIVQLFASGTIWPHLAASGQEVGLGFGLAILVGIPLGVLMGRVPLVRATLEPFIMAKYSSPTVAFLPLLIIWLGIGLWTKVVLVFLGAVFVLIINTEAGVSNVDRRLIETARSFTATEGQILAKIVIPSAVPFILAGLRLAIGRVLIMLVVAELYAATAGVGYLIFQGGAMYDTTLVFAGVVLLAATGMTFNHALRLLERRVAPWRRTEQE